MKVSSQGYQPGLILLLNQSEQVFGAILSLRVYQCGCLFVFIIFLLIMSKNLPFTFSDEDQFQKSALRTKAKKHSIYKMRNKIDSSINFQRLIMSLTIDRQIKAINQEDRNKKQPLDKYKQGEKNIIEGEASEDINNKGSALRKTELSQPIFFYKYMEIKEDQLRYKKDPQLLERLILEFSVKAQVIKRTFKQIEGLKAQDQFLLERKHKCQFCQKVFEKPCSLGGHMSKIHAKQKRLLLNSMKLEEE